MILRVDASGENTCRKEQTFHLSSEVYAVKSFSKFIRFECDPTEVTVRMERTVKAIPLACCS
jgi:hypothetical protein